jgi:hypothetical protein
LASLSPEERAVLGSVLEFDRRCGMPGAFLSLLSVLVPLVLLSVPLPLNALLPPFLLSVPLLLNVLLPLNALVLLNVLVLLNALLLYYQFAALAVVLKSTLLNQSLDSVADDSVVSEIGKDHHLLVWAAFSHLAEPVRDGCPQPFDHLG